LQEGRRFGWRFAGATTALVELDHSILDIAALFGARHCCIIKGRHHLPQRMKASCIAISLILALLRTFETGILSVRPPIRQAEGGEVDLFASCFVNIIYWTRTVIKVFVCMCNCQW